MQNTCSDMADRRRVSAYLHSMTVQHDIATFTSVQEGMQHLLESFVSARLWHDALRLNTIRSTYLKMLVQHILFASSHILKLFCIRDLMV